MGSSPWARPGTDPAPSTPAAPNQGPPPALAASADPADPPTDAPATSPPDPSPAAPVPNPAALAASPGPADPPTAETDSAVPPAGGPGPSAPHAPDDPGGSPGAPAAEAEPPSPTTRPAAPAQQRPEPAWPTRSSAGQPEQHRQAQPTPPPWAAQQWPAQQQWPGQQSSDQQWPPQQPPGQQWAAQRAPAWPGAAGGQPAQQWAAPAWPGQQAAPGQPWPGQPWPGGGPPLPPRPPRRGRRTLVALSAVGLLVLAALGVGAYLVTGELRAGQAAAGTVTVESPMLTYDVPADWAVGGEPLNDALGVEFTGIARGPAYDCASGQFVRGIVASASLPTAASPAPIATTAAQLLAEAYYTQDDGTPPDVRAGEARAVDVDGAQGQVVEATARTATDDGCLATDGTVLVLAVPLTGPDGSPSMALLVVNGDSAGGPPGAPPSPERATLEAIVASARLPAI